MGTHTGERPFKCELCNNKFTTKRNMQRHMKRCRSDKLYQCPVCKKSFAQEYQLTDHIKEHEQRNVGKADYNG